MKRESFESEGGKRATPGRKKKEKDLGKRVGIAQVFSTPGRSCQNSGWG